MHNKKLLELIFEFILIITTSHVLNVEGKEIGFRTIRHDHGIDYLKYVGIIPRNVKCLKWGYRTTHFDLFKLEIVCLQEPKEHDGSCPIWQDCVWRPYYNRDRYFSFTCSYDNDCVSSCKCCYSPCSGTFTCRPAINTRTSTAKPIIKSSTTETISTSTTMPQVTTETTSTTSQDVGSTNYDDNSIRPSPQEEITNELEYDNSSVEESQENVSPQGPNVLQEASNDYEGNTLQIEEVITKEDDMKNNIATTDISIVLQIDSVHQIGNEVSKVRYPPTPEPSLIRLGRPEIVDEARSDDVEGRTSFKGIVGNVFKDVDDEDMADDKYGSGDYK